MRPVWGWALLWLSLGLVAGVRAQMPEKPTVVSGEVTVHTTGTRMDVEQNSRFGIVNWESFSVGAGNAVHFANGAGATLNRVTGLTASEINGTLSATGSLFLLNRNGVIIGTDGRVLTGGDFVASTRDITDEDFLNGGTFTLFGDSPNGVTNLGKITSTGGNVLLAGYTVKNEGDITAAAGRVGLAAGNRVDVLTDVSWMNGAFAVSLGERGNDVTNEGRIHALVAELRAHNGNIYALAGNNTGLIQATGVRNEGGKVFLTAEGGTVQSSGTIVATRDEDGGDIEISAAAIENYGGTQDVSGATGGTIKLTADSITTDTEMLARGTNGRGGSITLDATYELLFTAAGLADASGNFGGGEIAVGAGNNVISGSLVAASAAGHGGRIALLGENVALLGATIDASGDAGGGSIFVGGGYQGAPLWNDVVLAPLRNLANSRQTYVGAGTLLRADATGEAGNGGTVVAWSDGTTQFAGTITARSGTAAGDGGLVETSGLEGLGVAGTVETAARGTTGENGTWLLDPKNITIGTVTDPLTEFQSFLGRFGSHPGDDFTALRFGTFLDLDDGTAAISGDPRTVSQHRAVYVFEGGQLAARLTSGYSANDSLFGAGVGVEGDYVFAVDPNESITHTIPNSPIYNTTGTVRAFRRGTGWRNGTANQVFMIYSEQNRLSPFDSQWGRPQTNFNIDGGNNQRFDTMTEQNGYITVVIGDPMRNGVFDRVGAVDTYRFNPATPPSGSVTIQGGYSAPVDIFNPTTDLRLGDWVAASNGMIYAGTGSILTSQQFDLYAGDWGHGLTRLTNYFASTGRPQHVTADGTSLFMVGQDTRLYTGTFGYLEPFFYTPLSITAGLGVVPLNTSFFGGNSFNYDRVSSVAVDGDTMLVSYIHHSAVQSGAGAIAIYQRSPGARWSDSALNPVFTYAFPASPTNLGYSQTGGATLALSGDYALASAPGWDLNSSVQDRGIVAGFSKTNGIWAFDANLRPGVQFELTQFGHNALAIDGNTYVIGDPFFGDMAAGGGNAGRIYVYENGVLAATLGTTNSTSLGYLGGAVAISGDRIAATGGSGMNGGVLLYAKGAAWRNGTANLASTYTAPSLGTNTDTGASYSSIAIDGGTVVAGASLTHFAFGYAGAIDVFTLTGNTLGTPLRLRPTGFGTPTGYDSFGYRVAVSGDTIAASHFTNWTPNSGNVANASRVIVFEKSGATWADSAQTVLSLDAHLTGGDNGLGFGTSLALAGNTLVAGYGSTGASLQSGRGVYVFERNGAWADSTAPVARLYAPGRGYGYSVATDGTRIVVGAPDSAGRGTDVPGYIPSYDPLFVYDRGDGWRNGDANLVATLKVGTPASPLPYLGFTVAVDGDRILANNYNGSHSALGYLGVYDFVGPFDLSGRATFASNPGATLNISAASLANSLSSGTNITLQANNDITVAQPITVNNPNGDGGDLTLQAGRRILVNASITTDNGDLTLIAGDPRANATYRDAGERVVVLGRDSNNQGVILTLGTGTLVINAADRFENRTGSTSPFVFDAVNPGRFVIYAATPDHTGAPDAANLQADLAIPDWDFVYYNTAFDVNAILPSFLPAGNGFVYTVQPAVNVAVGDASMTYGQAVPAASLTLTGLTVNGLAVSGTLFGIGANDLPNLVTTGLDGSVSVGTNGFVNAGFYAGGITAIARATVTSGSVYGVAVTTSGAGDLTVDKAVLNVRPDDATRTYRGDDPTLSVTYTGFVTGDDASVIDTPVSVVNPAGAASGVGGYTLTASGGADNNYTFNVTGTGLLTITPAELVLTGITGVDQTYDRTTTGGLAGTPTINPLGGDAVTLTGTLTATAVFSDPNVGVDKPLTVSGFGLAGAAAGNYTLVLPTNLTADILPAPLTLSGITAQGRVYDGTATAATSGTAIITPIAGDNVSLAGSLTALFADKTVGTNKPITFGGLTLTGDDAGNYILSFPELTAAITPYTLDVAGLVALSRVYDRTTTATITGTPSITPVAGDDVALAGTATGTFNNHNAGTNKAVTVGGLSLTGYDAGNYRLLFPTLFANITPAPLVITGITGVDRFYDGTTTAYYSGVITVTPIAGDSVVATGAGTGTFADKNAGTDKLITYTGFGIAGLDAANYYVVQPIGITADIWPRLITVTGIAPAGKTYDGTTSLVTTGTPIFGNLVAGDDATFVVDSPVFSFPSAAAGYYQNLLVAGVSLTGADAANYDTTRLYNLGLSISPAALTLSGVTAVNRVYDGTTLVALSGGTLSGILGADDVTLSSAGATGTLADKTIGEDKAVTVTGFSLTGSAAGNYYVVQPLGLTADITAYTLNLTGLNGDKIYDGTNLATFTQATLDAVFGGDDVSVDSSAVTATYADKNVGVDKAITLSGLFGLTGTDAANYVLNQPSSLTGTITPRAITVSGLTIADKVYDGTTAGIIAGTGTFGGAIAGDDLSINVGAIDVTFADKNVGTNKTIALSGVTLAGADAGNYTAATPTGITASITAREITVTGLAAENKVYDRTTTAALAGTGALVGVIGGDTVGLNESARAGSFADKHAAEDKTVSVTGLTLTGGDAANYRVIAPTLLATIFRADVDLHGLTALDRIYDGTAVAALAGTAALDFGLLNQVLASAEDVSLTGTAAGSFADKNAGVGKAVTVSGVGLAGADANNYTLRLPTGLTADISPASLAVTGAAVANKTYDATVAATITTAGTITALGADAVTLVTMGASAVFADKNAGTGKAVTLSGYTLTGDDAANYQLVQPSGMVADIAPADLMITGLVADDKIYDGTTNALLSGSLAVTPFGADQVSVRGAPVSHFTTATAGENKAVNVAGLSLSGTDAINYRLVLPNLAADILQRTVTLGGITALDRVYDGTTAVALAGAPTLANLVAGDDVAFSLAAILATFADKTVGLAKAVTLTGNGLTGGAAGNYRVVLPFNLTASVTPRDLALTGVNPVNRAYDGTATIALTGGALQNTVAGDAIQLITTGASGRTADRNVGENKAVTASGYTLGGGDAGNYRLAQPTGLFVTITPRPVTITGMEVADKFYDGTTTATISGGTLGNVIAGDDIRLLTGSGRGDFNTPAVGNNKPVTPLELALSGADAANYQLDPALDLRGNILAALQVITDVIPAEVLRATANAEIEKQRQALDALNATQKNLVTLVDYTTQTARVASGIVVPVVAKELASIPEGQRTTAVSQYLSFAATAEAASARAQALAEEYREASAAFKELGQSINADNRALATERQLRSTYEGRIAAADAELAKARENLATIDEARRRIDTLTRQMEDAARLGRGSEVAAYQQAIDEARGILAGEAAARAQFDQLSAAAQQARDQLAESEAKIASLTAGLNEKLGKIRDAEKEIKSLEQQTTQAKFAAASAAENLEMARAGVETDLRRMVGDTDQKIAELEQKGPPDLNTWVEQMMARDGGQSFSLSPERKQTIDNAQAAIATIDRRAAELDRTKADALQVQNNAPATVRSVATSSRVQTQIDGKSAAELAQLDPKALGLSDRQLLPSDSPAIQDLSRAAAEVSSALGSVGRTVPVVINGRLTQVPLELEGADPARGVNNLDAPVSFSPQAETALKAELQAYGVLPKFTNNALADLPVAAQMQLQQAMQAAKKTQDRLIAQGVDPNVAAQQAFDQKTNDLMTMVLFEAVDKYGIGDIPGVQAFVSAAIGELSAQYGVSPSGMAENLVSGDLKGLMGDGADTAKIITGQAQKIVTNPVEAGVEIFTNAVDVLKAGGEAFVDVFTGQSARDAEKAKAEAQAKFDARRNTLLSFGSKLAQLETDRQDAVAARDANFAQVKDVIVAQAQVKEVEQALPQLATERVAAVENARVTEEQVRREQVTATSANGIEVAKQQYAAELAQAKATKERLAGQLAAVVQAKPGEGGQ